MLGSVFSGLIVFSKIVPMDLCTDNGCFSTGFGQDLLQVYNVTAGSPQKAYELPSMTNFMLQAMNNTIASGLPWAGGYSRGVEATNVPKEIYRVPLDRLKKPVEYSGIYNEARFQTVAMGLEYANGTFVVMTPGVTLAWNSSAVNNYTTWAIYDYEVDNTTFTLNDTRGKSLQLTATTVTGLNLLLISAINDEFGDVQSRKEILNYLITNNTSSYVKRATYYGTIMYTSWLGVFDVTFRSQNDGNSSQLEFSSFNNTRKAINVDADELFNATLHNLRSNVNVLLNHSRELLWLIQNANQGIQTATDKNGDFLSYVATCYVMAVSQTRPVGMIRGHDQADIATPVIAINVVLLIPLFLVAAALFVPYAVLMCKLRSNDEKWIPYKLHVDPQEYIINLCLSMSDVVRPRSEKELKKIIGEDHGDSGPVFGNRLDEEYD
ncbi:hypothetical protein BGZ83_001109 [Gryganskiella cystojenkinii]|nr:hypothetical protein BGZ83_001109 [Gryganskiella cystojenkinii]